MIVLKRFVDKEIQSETLVLVKITQKLSPNAKIIKNNGFVNYICPKLVMIPFQQIKNKIFWAVVLFFY